MNTKFYPIVVLIFLAGLCGIVQAQTTLFTENFNGGSHSFTLNSTDVTSTADADNYWIVNNVYTGGSGTGMCLGILPVTFSFTNTPAEPAGITGNPSSNYLHITSKISVGGGILNAGYFGPDGICVNEQNTFFKMTTDINTSAYQQVEVKFWWMGTGAPNSVVEMYYSTNGGSTWTIAPAPFDKLYRIVDWKQESVILPAFAGNNTFRIGFRLKNATSTPFTDLAEVGYSFDDFEIIGSTTGTNPTISTSFSAQPTYCPGAQITVPFSSTGTFSGGNMYKVQLSDASGSFTSPVEIGNITSTSNSGSIPATIPMGSAQGSGYRVRVISTSPSVNGSPNATDFAVGPGGAITISTDPVGLTNLCTGSITLSIPSGYTNIQWTPGNQTSNSIVVTTPGDYSVSGTSASGCQSQSEVMAITAAAAPAANFTYTQPSGYLIEFTNTSVNGVTYSWNFGSATTTSVNPTFTFPFDGDYPVTLIATSPCGSDTTTITVNVKKLVGIEDVKLFEAITLFPNPVKESLQLTVKSKEMTHSNISIFNTIGGKVFDQTMTFTGEQTHQINFRSFSPGIYFVRISTDKGQSTYKVVKD